MSTRGYHCTRPHQGKLSLVEASPGLVEASPGLVRPSPGLTRGLEPLLTPGGHFRKTSTRGYQTPPGQIKPGGGLTSPGETLTRAHQGFGTPGGHFRKISTRCMGTMGAFGQSALGNTGFCWSDQTP